MFRALRLWLLSRRLRVKRRRAVTQAGGSLPEKITQLSQGSIPSAVRDNEADGSRESGMSSSARTVESEGHLVDIPLDSYSASTFESPPGRQRQDSGSSTGSYDSIFLHNYAPSTAKTFVSDLESIADEDTISQCSTSFSESASMERVSSTLNKLSTRAARYRDKYKKALEAYRNLLSDNEKLRNALSSTQERAVERIRELRDKRMKETEDFQQTVKELNEKVAAVERAGNEDLEKHNQKVSTLEELLRRCKESITNYKSTIESMKCENEALKKRIEETEAKQCETEFSNHAREIERLEKEWQLKVARMEEEHSMAVAKVKQELYTTNEAESESLNRQLECVTNELNQTKQQLERFTSCVQAVENEKKELVSKLAAVKQASMRAIMEEEKQKRDALVAEYEKKLMNLEKAKTEELSAIYDAKYKQKEKQLELEIAEERSQMMLEAEEREMQKSAAILSQDELVSRLQLELEEAHTAEAELRSRIAEQSELLSKLNQAEIALSKKTKELAAKESVIAVYEAEMETKMKTATESFHAKFKGLQQQLDQMETLQRANEQYQSMIQSKDADISRLNSMVDRLTTELKDAVLSNDSNPRIADLEVRLSLKENQLMELEEKHNELIAKSQQLMITEAGRSEQAAEIEKSYRSKVTELEDLVTLSASELTKFRDQVSCAVEEINTYKRQLEEETDKKEYLEKLLHEQQCKYEEYCVSVQHELNDLKVQLGVAEKATAELECLLTVSRTECGNLMTTLEKTNSDLASANERCEQLQMKYGTLVNESKPLQSTIESLREQLEQRQNDIDKLLSEEKRLLTEVNAEKESARQMSSEIEALKNDAVDVRKDTTDKAINLFGIICNGYSTLLDIAGDLSLNCNETMGTISPDFGDHGRMNELSQQQAMLDGSISSSLRQLKHLHEECSWNGFMKSQIWTETPDILKKSFQLNIEVVKLKEQAVNENATRDTLAEIEALNVKVKNLSAIRDFFQGHVGCLKSFAAHLQSLYSSDFADVNAKQEANVMRRVIERLQFSCDQWPIETDSSVSLFSDLWDSLERFFSAVRIKLEAQQSKLDLLQERTDSLTSSLRVSEEKLQDTVDEYKILLDILQQIFVQLESMEYPIQDTEQLTKLCNEISSSPLAHTNFVEQLKRLLIKCASKRPCISCADLQANLANMTSELKCCQTQLTQKRFDLDDISRRLRQDMDGILNQASGNFERVQCNLNNYEVEFSHLVELVRKLRSCLEEQRTVDAQVASLRLEVGSLKSVLREKEHQIDALKKSSAWSDWEDNEQLLLTNATQSIGNSRGENPYVNPEHGTNLSDTVQDHSEYIGDTQDSLLLPNGSSLISHHPAPASPQATDHVLHNDSSIVQNHTRFDSVDFHPLFAEPTEAEYLKNILYRYMVERETLGKESVTLAKAIAAVVKFSPSQTKLVLLKEESRNASSW